MVSLIESHKQRNSSFELLRILCMLFVIGGHLISKGMQISYNSNLLGGVDYYLSRLLYSFCIVAVSTFILISGFFSIRFNWRKLAKIWFSVIFFSWLIVAYKIFIEKDFMGSLPYILPITSNQYWFISCYFVLCILAPLLNKMVEILSKSSLKNLLVISFIIIYGWATFNYILNFRQFVPDFGGGIINFIILYLIGRYIRIYGLRKCPPFFWLCAFICNTILMVTLELLYSSFLHFGFTSFENINSIFVVLSAIFLFLTFKDLHFHNKYINLLAVYCLSVYVIHFNDIGMPFLTTFFNLKELNGLNILWIVLYVPPVVYIVCTSIEFIRRSIFNKLEDRLLDKISVRWKLN